MKLSAEELTELIKQLSEKDQEFVEKVIERLVIKNDLDEVKLTPQEAKKLKEAMQDDEVITQEEFDKEIGM